jgi:hypothetical protein
MHLKYGIILKAVNKNGKIDIHMINESFREYNININIHLIKIVDINDRLPKLRFS